MEPIFEAKYLAIKWFDKNTVSSITEAMSTIPIEVENTTSYHMEIQAYSRESGLDMQVAFRIYDTTSDIEPYFVDANSDDISLLKIIDPNTKKAWWIEDGSWSNKYNYRMSELWNHVGRATAYFGDVVCNTDIRTISFTTEQLNLYLEDFKNDFWWLILKKNSLTQVEGRNNNEQIKILNKETINLIQEFIKHTQDILKNPKKELKEIQGLKELKKVKPVAKTFMEIATGGMKRKLTSRDTIESYNVAENRYVHYALYQVYNIVLNMTRISQYTHSFYQNKIKSEQKRIENFKDILIIDKEIIENKITSLKKKISDIKNTLEQIEQKQDQNIKQQCEEEVNKPTLQNKINSVLQNQNIQLRNNNEMRTIYIKLGRRKDYQEKMQFEGTIKEQEADEWFKFKNKNNFFSLEFDKNIFNKLLQENTEYKITANIIRDQRSWQKNNRSGIIHKRYFRYISELEPLKYIEPTRTITHKTLRIKLQKKQNNFDGKVLFWGKSKSIDSKEWDQLNQRDSLSLEFDFDIFNHILQEDTEYEISSYIKENKIPKKKTGTIHKWYFKYITKIEQKSNFFLDKDLNYFNNQTIELEKIKWERELTPKEKQEQEKEKLAIRKQIELLNEESRIGNEYIQQLKPLISSLKNTLAQFDKLSIAKDSYFPNSMTFIQNPYYQGAYKYYELIKNIVGIDESLFLSIQKVEKIGVLDIPTLYERWCFLQIIKVIIEQYHFLPEEDWKQKLMLQMIGNQNEVRKKIKNISINFSNPKSERKIILHYEKELNGHNSKRPDYLLEIVSLITNKKHNLIMDAKFREDVEVKDLIEELYHKKDYSQKNKNSVFILHPDTKNSIKKMNPSDWGTDAYYGEVQMFDYKWDSDEFPNHKYGSILLSPIRDNIDYGNYLDNLQRLIGMSLQYQLEDNKKNNITLGDLALIEPIPKEKGFCLKCGSSTIRQITAGLSRSKKGKYYQMECEDCKHHFVYFYCWNCKQRLIKNGRYWSYHSFQPLKPFDIQCPHCAKFWHENENHQERNEEQIINQNYTTIQNINKNEAVLTNELVFNNHEEGCIYAKEHPGVKLVRNPNGAGWIIKK